MIVEIRLTLKELETYIGKCQNPFLIVDHQLNIFKANSYLLAVTGYRMEDMAGFPVERWFAFDHPFPSLLERVSTQNENGFKIKIASRDKQEFSVGFTIHDLIIEDQSYYLLLLDHDAGYGLNLLQRFSGTFMKDVNLGVILINTEFELVDISDMACRVLGVTRDEVINKSMEEAFSFVPSEHQLVQRSLLDGVIVRNHAISWMNNQERYELLMDSNLLKDDTGKIAGAYVIFKDVTNLRSLEEQVQRSDRLAMIGQIAAGTAHEIRNPLTSIKGFMQVLKRTLMNKGMEKEHGYTEIILTEIDRINELVNEFLFLSKPKNVTFVLVDISTVLREILPIINNEAILHGVTVQYQSAFGLPKVVGDRELFKQVCLNICKNGIEAMVEGGILTLTEEIDIDEQKVNIEIHDTGPGIPSFLIDKIFDPFFTTKEDGTGLGLSVCQRIIHDIGGAIRVSSKGYGTTFTISIPFSNN